MKYVGVSAPAWTIAERPKTPPMKPVDDLPLPPVVDSDALSRQHLYPRAPTVVFVPPALKSPPPEEYDEEEPRKKEKEHKKKIVATNPLLKGAERFDKTKKSTAPDPGTYQKDLRASISDSMPNFSFGYRWDTETEKKERIDPADMKNQPGVYFPKYAHREFVRGGKIYSKPFERNSKAPPPFEGTPGPGMYNILDEGKEIKKVSTSPDKLKRSKSKGTFGTSLRSALHNTSTACDYKLAYNVNQHTIAYNAEKVREVARSKPTPTIKKSTSAVNLGKDSTEDVPLITNTANRYVPSGPQWKFSEPVMKKFRKNAESEDPGPGPGQYYNLEEFENKQKFPPLKSTNRLPKAKRKPLNDNLDSVGPGLYFKKPSEVDEAGMKAWSKLNGPQGPKFSMRQKLEPPGNLDLYRLPGPGNYETEHNFGIGYVNNGPKIGTRDKYPKPLKEEGFSGPGMYNINRDLGTQEGIKFPKSKRKPMATDADPDVEIGPGHYNLKSTVPQIQPFEEARMRQIETLGLTLD